MKILCLVLAIMFIFAGCSKSEPTDSSSEVGGYASDVLEYVDASDVSFTLGNLSSPLSVGDRPLYLAERMDEFPLYFGLLYFTTEGREECAEIIDAYKKGIPPKGDYTRGLYYRGVE